MNRAMGMLVGCAAALAVWPARAEVRSDDVYPETASRKKKASDDDYRAIKQARYATRSRRQVEDAQVVEDKIVDEKHADKYADKYGEAQPEIIDESMGVHEGCFDGCCAPEFWEHRCGFFAEYLLMRAGGNDMAHGFQRNGTVPAGHVGVIDQEYETGFRAGFSRAISSCSSWGASFTRVDSHGTDSIDSPDINGGETASLVLHPGFVNAGTASAFLDAEHDIDMQLSDLEYRRVFSGSCDHVVNYLVGVRYGNLEQNFAQIGSFAQPTGDILTVTDIDFDGMGLRLGIEGRRRTCCGWSMYGRTSLSMLFGDFQTEFVNFNATTETVLAAADWEDTRIMPILDYEFGISWTSCNEKWVLSIGYLSSIWFNAVTTPEYIKAVQADSYVDVSDTLTFDGLSTKVEFRY